MADNPGQRGAVHGGVRALLVAAIVCAGGCLTTRVGPGVLRQDWNQRPRNPDPLANPATVYRDDRWSDEKPERIRGPGEESPDGEAEPGADEDSATADLAKRTVATFLASGIAGWLPLVEASGSFEEDPATRRAHQQRRARAERRAAERRRRRVEAADR